MTKKKPESLKILGVEIQDFKRIEVASIRPDGLVSEISGRNANGKSSILDAIESALGGKRRQPQEPIRRGAERAYVVVNLGDFLVERVWTAKTDRLVVRSKDGAIFPKGQAKLDDLIGAISFDPLEFLSMPAKRQREMLLGVIGVDLDEIEERRSAIYDERRAVGRDLRAAEQRLADAPEVDAPDEEVSIENLSRKLSEALSEGERIRSKKQQSESAYRAAENERERLAQALEDLRQQMADLEERVEWAGVQVDVTSRAYEEIRDVEPPSVAEIQEQLSEADEINRRVRQRKQRERLISELESVQEQHNNLDTSLAAIDAEKNTALEGAEMPIDGLAITEDGLTFEGIPLSQASMSQRVRVCTAISAALNPKLRIALVRSGNDLDDESLADFYSYCEEVGLQAWVERINGTRDDALVIEEGRIVGAEVAQESAA